MSLLPPQTISLKRRRNEAPVDALRFDETDSSKRRKSNYAYRRLTKPNDAPVQSHVPPTPTAERRFQLEAASVSGAKRVFVEARPTTQEDPNSQHSTTNGQSQTHVHKSPQEPTPDSTAPRPRKRPGAASALGHASKPSLHNPIRTLPSEQDLRTLEALSREVEKTDNLSIPLPTPSPSKHKPRAPAQRFADRHPEKAAALAKDDHTSLEVQEDTDMMEIDTDYVIDTYIREPLLPNTPLPSGTTVGLLILNPDDDDWWTGEDSASEKFDTDDEDENAEDYYANDYPEDELSEDDELGRDVYQAKYRHGSDEEEWGDAVEEDEAALASGEDEDDVHFRMTVPKVKRVDVGGYWGVAGE